MKSNQFGSIKKPKAKAPTMTPIPPMRAFTGRIISKDARNFPINFHSDKFSKSQSLLAYKEQLSLRFLPDLLRTYKIIPLFAVKAGTRAVPSYLIVQPRRE